MKLPGNNIPIYDFAPEDDLGNLAIRYMPLEVMNDYDFSEPHRHNFYELFFFDKGGGSHLIDFVEHAVADKSMHIVKPGQVHLLKRKPDSHGAVVHFSKEMALSLQAASAQLRDVQTPAFSYNTNIYNTVATLLGLLQAELTGNAPQRGIPENYLSLLLLKGIVQEQKPAVAPEAKTRQHFTAFQQLAEAHYRTGKLPAWYAAELHITEKRLNEACRNATGNTVSHYLKERVLLEAKRLLSHSAGNIKEIGYYLGFEDPAYFTRFFRKNAGITAGDFRNKYK